MIDYSRRAEIAEFMDDLSRPDAEFLAAYRDLTAINRWLGGIRAVERFLPEGELSILDVAAGACDVGEALMSRTRRGARRVVALDLNARGLLLARRTVPVAASAFSLPFRDKTFDVAAASLFFHHITDAEGVLVLREMWRVARRRVIVNDLHRHPVAYRSIQFVTRVFGAGVMARNDGPISVLRAFKPAELAAIARQAGIPATVHRCLPYRLVLVADKVARVG